ncbi:MAG TPA: TatD family hydrolase [Vicinamibacterales bacterium]
MIDSHCHIAGEEFAGDLEEVVARAKQAGVSAAMCILAADDPAEGKAIARVQALWPEVQVATGIHPHQAGAHGADVPAAIATVRRVATERRAIAIGEIGLDYHYDFSPRDIQQAIFSAQVALANDLGLPVVIHTREATDDTFRILRAAPGVRGVFHCFTGDRDMARAALDIGFYLSFAGIVTFPKAAELREVAKLAPEDRLLAETDSPYLAPVPFRGTRNEPAHVARVVESLAEARGVPRARMAEAVARNFQSLFGLAR